MSIRGRNHVVLTHGPQTGRHVPWDDALLFVASPEGRGYVLAQTGTGMYKSLEYHGWLHEQQGPA